MPKISPKLRDAMNRGELNTKLHDAKEDGRITRGEAKQLGKQASDNIATAANPRKAFVETSKELSALRTTKGVKVDANANAALRGADVAAFKAMSNSLESKSHAAAEAINKAAVGSRAGSPYPLGALVTNAIGGNGDGSVVTLTLDRSKLPPGEDAETLGRALKDLIKSTPALKGARDANVSFDIALIGKQVKPANI